MGSLLPRDKKMESTTHKKLRMQAADILQRHGWKVRHADNGQSAVDITAVRLYANWLIEVEYSCDKENVKTDLSNGAEIFIAPASKIEYLNKLLNELRSSAPAVTIEQFAGML